MRSPNVTLSDPDLYISHTPVSDPGTRASVLDQFEPDIRTLPEQVSALMIHPAVAAMRGQAITPEQNHDRQRRSVADLLDHLLRRDGAWQLVDTQLGPDAN
tara:strand:+ start:7558 stop:7860 length:303 start_codon:yes stop_codon:yes gene_type:complete